MAAATPADLAAQRDLLAVSGKLGFLKLRQGDAAGAKADYANCVRVARLLAEAAPGNRRGLAVVLNQLGDAELQSGESGSAGEHYKSALKICQTLAAAAPDEVLAQNDLAYCCYESGRAAESAGRMSQAGEFYDRALGILQPLNDSGKLKDSPQYIKLIDLLRARSDACRKAAATMPSKTQPSSSSRDDG